VRRLNHISHDPEPAPSAGFRPFRDGPRRWRNVAQLILAAACWGTGTVVSKQAIAELPPLTLLPMQLAASVAVLLVVTRLRGERMAGGREGRLLGRLGLLNPGLAYALSLIGLTEITASLSVLVWASEPILILVLAAMVLGDRIGPAIVAPSIAAVAGLMLVVFDPGAAGTAFGVALTIAGVVACAVYTVATRRWLLGADSTFGVVLAQQAHALALSVVVLVGLALAGRAVLPGPLTNAGVLSAVASGLLYYALAYSFYLSALRNVRASIAAASFYLIPVFGLAGGWLVGERLQPLQWIGAVVVVASVAIITVRAARPAAEPDERGQPSSAAASTQMATAPSSSIRR
jgi:probable blue pigment (indigoidine) exporter